MKTYDELDPNSEIDAEEIKRRDKEAAEIYWERAERERQRISDQMSDVWETIKRERRRNNQFQR